MILNKKQKKELCDLEYFLDRLEDDFKAHKIDIMAAAAKESHYVSKISAEVVMEYYKEPSMQRVNYYINQYWQNKLIR